jgi:hypothetical protein
MLPWTWNKKDDTEKQRFWAKVRKKGNTSKVFCLLGKLAKGKKKKFFLPRVFILLFSLKYLFRSQNMIAKKKEAYDINCC